ncbi:hypothetical protein B0H17DRAFT_1138365 [Mycena rosella]|uniref:Uncharacterized protein n=1 Tax=Mycena rosella TaxID=1033263 RepID=A0AAD7GA01_MYCRO|nr:hypothetical protein B0H17DRAFT_1138365 [Mycena rosella]
MPVSNAAMDVDHSFDREVDGASILASEDNEWDSHDDEDKAHRECRISVIWRTEFPTKRPLTLFYRNPVELLETLLQNPLVQDHIHYTPFRLYTTAAKTMRAYSEWLSGDLAWELQASGEKIPAGATLIGSALATDKTQITTMTGNRTAHPAVLTAANIDKDFRMKASHHVFLLAAILPITQFLEQVPNTTVFYTVGFTSLYGLVFTPLKEAARVGIMISDAFGKRRFATRRSYPP